MVRWDEAFFVLVGIPVLLAGIGEILLGVTGGEFQLSIVTISGTFLLWRGVILVFAGGFYVHGALSGLDDRRSQAIVFMGSLMIWIVAGNELLATVLGAIPGGPDVWFASGTAILTALGPPYSPAVVVLPLSFVAFTYTRGRVRALAGGVR